MSIVENIIQKIYQIIKISNSVYVYTELCNSIVNVLEEIRDKVSTLQSKQQNTSLNAVFNQLNSLYNFINGFTLCNYFEKCSKMPITKPVSIFNEIINSISEALKENGILLQNKYSFTEQSIYNDVVRLNRIFSNPEIVDNPKFKGIIDSIDEYFDVTSPLSIKSIPKKSINIESQNSTEPNHADNDDDELFSDYSSVKTYIIKETDYKKKKKIKYPNKHYKVYDGIMKYTNDEVTIMILNEAPNNREKFRRLVNIYTAIRYQYLEELVGAVNNPPLYAVVTKRVGIKLFDILSKKKSSKKSKMTLEKGYRTIIAFNIALAMAYLHSNNIIHRDLCSSNISIDKDCNPRINNFANSRPFADDADMTRSLQTIAIFKAPELINETYYDRSVDVFAFGGILYELMMGSFTDPDIQKKIIGNDLDDLLNDISDDISDDMRNLIKSCWLNNPKERPSFYEIIDNMISKNITFPIDKNSEIVNTFYLKKTIKNDDVKDCLKLFQRIKDEINDCFVYKNEAIRIRSILHEYQYHIQTAKFLTLCQINNINNKVQLENLKETLKDLLEIISRAGEDIWKNSALYDPATDISTKIFSYMEQMYIEMTELGFSVIKYDYVDVDLFKDYNEIYEIFLHNANIPEANERMKEIESFLKERSINLTVDKIEFDGTIKQLLNQYKDLELHLGDFKYDFEDSSTILGHGATSIVKKAKYLKNSKYVAIKEFTEDYLDFINPVNLKRELFFLIKLHHKYLVKFVGFISDPFCVVSKMVDGGDLYHAVKKLSAFEKTKIAFEIAEGMEYLHSKHVIHRDLKTLNVLIHKGSPKITDFGYSRSISLVMSKNVGTPHYMSPEMIKSGEYGGYYDYKTDVFSYASVLWELYSGEVPFKKYHNNSDRIQTAILYGEELPFGKIKGKVPILENLIKRGRDSDPQKRPSFTEILIEMLNNKIAFYGADQNDINEFYRMKAEERPELVINQDDE